MVKGQVLSLLVAATVAVPSLRPRLDMLASIDADLDAIDASMFGRLEKEDVTHERKTSETRWLQEPVQQERVIGQLKVCMVSESNDYTCDQEDTETLPPELTVAKETDVDARRWLSGSGTIGGQQILDFKWLDSLQNRMFKSKWISHNEVSFGRGISEEQAEAVAGWLDHGDEAPINQLIRGVNLRVNPDLEHYFEARPKLVELLGRLGTHVPSPIALANAEVETAQRNAQEAIDTMLNHGHGDG